jgi:hypothetical protein
LRVISRKKDCDERKKVVFLVVYGLKLRLLFEAAAASPASKLKLMTYHETIVAVGLNLPPSLSLSLDEKSRK